MIYSIVLVMLVILIIGHKKRKKELLWPTNEAVQATFFHCDLSSKLREMEDDPQTTYQHWKDILPVCRYSDEWFAKTHPYMKNFGKNEEAAKQMMR